MLKGVLELEGYTVILTQNASKATRAIEDSSDSYLLMTDNFHLNLDVREALTHSTTVKKYAIVSGR